ncbi:MAG: Fe(2+)-trafficking protein [Phycisphaeraceae bacterium]
MAADIEQRIEQWEKMTREAPDDMAWFSLGNAYRDAGRLEEAAEALSKAIAQNAGMSRAYQLRAQVLMQLDRNDEAGAVLTTGYTVAVEKGDVMPQRAMESLLQKLGQPVPEVAKKVVPPQVAAGDAVMDRKTGQPGTKLPDPPMRGPLGKFIYDHYSQQTWREWIGQGTKVINELRLDFSNQGHQKIYEQHMMEWLGITDEDVAAYAKEQGEK